MKITVCGATGRIGQELVKRALVDGHDVTAIVRDPSRLPVRADRLDVVVADVFDGAAIAPAIKGRDAVLSAVGPRPDGPTTVCSDTAAALRWALPETGVRRLIVVSASGPYVDGGDDPLTRYAVKPILRRVLREGWADLVRAEEVVRSSGLDWTILRPSRLTDQPATGRVRRRLDRNLPLGMFTPRAEVAVEMLRVLRDPTTFGHSIALAR
ncbi:SDR family oxidoreductase [Hamadaea sp. NPDC051192]|uniref:NAD(P)-dependent oxidoreductase n=1 Tax=Hamadaea sp. NPDC051192 TaxID=3154940 RepID=UPI0034274563